jgi:hypothetical protein
LGSKDCEFHFREDDMSRFAEALAALPAFRTDMLRSDVVSAQFTRPGEQQLWPGFFQTSLHATGIGLRPDSVDPDDVVFKLFVFNTEQFDAPRKWHEFDVDVEKLSVQQKYAAVPNRQRYRPIPGGVSTAPLGAGYIGTLGCFLRPKGSHELLALSNNHVFADVNRLAIGTQICQLGPETGPTKASDIYASLSQFIPLVFTPGSANDHDAAVARVSEANDARLGAQLGIATYAPANIVQPTPGLIVTKSGRTTGVTAGTITAVNVNGVQVNYADPNQPPKIAVFNNAVRIVGNLGVPFSLPGDSGSLIITQKNGEPTAHLYAGDGVNTFASPIGSLCNRLLAWPV